MNLEEIAKEIERLDKSDLNWLIIHFKNKNRKFIRELRDACLLFDPLNGVDAAENLLPSQRSKAIRLIQERMK